MPAQPGSKPAVSPAITDAIAAISALKSSERINAARHVKNAVVGNPTNKRLYLSLGLLPALLTAAAQGDPQLTEQSVAALGSVSHYFPPNAFPTVTPVILKALFSSDQRPVTAAVRALKLILSSPSLTLSQISPSIATLRVAERLVSLLNRAEDGVAEVSAIIISKASHTKQHARVFETAQAIPALLALLHRTNHERCVEACLNALSALAALDVSLTRLLTASHTITSLLLPLTRSSVHTLRLAACRLLTIFHAAAHLPSGVDTVVVSALVQLLTTDHPPSQIATAYTLADLVQHSEHLQRIATESEAIHQLATIIKGNPHPNPHNTIPAPTQPSLHASALTALAALCSHFDDAREKLIDQNVLSHIIHHLFSSESPVVLAAMKCLRSLSRSVKIVRRDIASDVIARRLLKLLTSDDVTITRCASATICNLVLDFSPVRSVILSAGGTETLVTLLRSKDEDVRNNSLLALKNLLFKADSATKTTVMSQLGYDELHSLCLDQHPRVRELAMTIVRNLACSLSAESQSKQLDALLAATGDRLISLLSGALKLDRENSEIAVQALYVVCNIASGTEAHKACVMQSDIPKLILQWTSHENEQARIAAVWCAINLSWKDRPVSPRRSTRMARQRLRCSGRMHLNRLDLLRRQHLPLPSSPVDRAELDRSESTDQNASSPSSQPNDHSLDTDMGTGSISPGGNEEQNVESSTATDQDTEMSVPQEEEQQAPKSSGYEWRIGRLRELGYEGILRSLVNDPHVEVQGRARAALELFDCEDVSPLDCSPSALLDYSPSALLGRQSPRSAPALLPVAESDSSSAGSSS